MSSLIVGTAGHIDHGKSALVRALTGIDPDRLPEEKRRGITIDLGFADLELDGLRIGFVDVPGHERFIKNMLAGAHGIDLLVVKLEEAKKGFVLLPRRWVVERTFAWLGRFRRLARDYERLSQTLAGFNWIAAVSLMLSGVFALLQSA